MNLKIKSILLGIMILALGGIAYAMSGINADKSAEAQKNVSAGQNGVPSSEEADPQNGFEDYDLQAEQEIIAEEDHDWQVYLNSQQDIAEIEENYEYSEY